MVSHHEFCQPPHELNPKIFNFFPVIVAHFYLFPLVSRESSEVWFKRLFQSPSHRIKQRLIYLLYPLLPMPVPPSWVQLQRSAASSARYFYSSLLPLPENKTRSAQQHQHLPSRSPLLTVHLYLYSFPLIAPFMLTISALPIEDGRPDFSSPNPVSKCKNGNAMKHRLELPFQFSKQMSPCLALKSFVTKVNLYNKLSRRTRFDFWQKQSNINETLSKLLWNRKSLILINTLFMWHLSSAP